MFFKNYLLFVIKVQSRGICEQITLFSTDN